MALSGKSGRQGSAEKPLVIPHTRIEEESHLHEYYDIGRKLGEGTFGIVKEVVHKETGKVWACKAVNKEKAGNPGIKLLEREVAILKRVHHEHIILLKEIFESSKKMYLIMEYCDRGELADVLKEKQTFSESDVKVIIERLAKAIAYLHKHDMVHRDLKLENILLAKNPEDNSDDLYIKVTDFGLSVVKSGVGVDNLLMDFCGTPMYMAPEIIDNKTYGEKCDVWAMGVIAFLLFSGTPPFHSREEDKLYEIIKAADMKVSMSYNDVWKSISKKAKHCVEKMLIADPAHRYSAREILDHPWITGQDFDSMRPGNVLDMMKAWRTDPALAGDDDSDGAINGEDSSIDIQQSSEKATKSVSSSRSSSASSEKKGDRRSSTTNIGASSSKSKKVSSQAGSSQSKGSKVAYSNTNRNNASQTTQLPGSSSRTTNKATNGLPRVSSETSMKSKRKPQR